jgi:hypothetical protein
MRTVDENLKEKISRKDRPETESNIIKIDFGEIKCKGET